MGLVLVGGVAVRLGAAGDASGALAVLCGCGFVPALALGCGILSGGSRLFEGIYVALWYLGPLNRATAVDFAGVSVLAAARFVPAGLLAGALALVGVAVAVSRRRAADRGARFA